MTPLITLTTDFGERDPYVAAMKGVLSSLAPESSILDLTHEIPPCDIQEAALFLLGALPWFPEGSIHIVVVDPGVGTNRNALAADMDGRIVLCPDNGLLSHVKQKLPSRTYTILDPANCSHLPLSATFHGRDLFAPAAARIATGTPMEQLGDTIETIVELAWTEPRSLGGGRIEGEVVHIDRFGNCITNIPGDGAELDGSLRIDGTVAVKAGLVRTYGDVPPGETVALVGSGGLLELALSQGNAAAVHGIARGARATWIRGTNRGE